MSFPTKQGQGSGIDADKLDGKDSTFYLDIEARLGYPPANKAGDTMLNSLYVFRTPEEELEIANKAYVDDAITAITDLGGESNACKPAIAWFNEGLLIGAGRCIDFVGSSVAVSFDENTEIATITIAGSSLEVDLENELKVASVSGMNFETLQIVDCVMEQDNIEPEQVNIVVYDNQLKKNTTAPITAAQHFPFYEFNFLEDNPPLNLGQNFKMTYTHPGVGTPKKLVHFPKFAGNILDGVSFNLLIYINPSPAGKTVSFYLAENPTSVEYGIGKKTEQVENKFMYKHYAQATKERAWLYKPEDDIYPGYGSYTDNNMGFNQYGRNYGYQENTLTTNTTKILKISGIALPSAVIGVPSYFCFFSRYN